MSKLLKFFILRRGKKKENLWKKDQLYKIRMHFNNKVNNNYNKKINFK